MVVALKQRACQPVLRNASLHNTRSTWTSWHVDSYWWHTPKELRGGCRGMMTRLQGGSLHQIERRRQVQNMPICSDPGLNKLLFTTRIHPRIVVELGPMLRASVLGRTSSGRRFTVAEAHCSMPQRRRTSCQEHRSS